LLILQGDHKFSLLGIRMGELMRPISTVLLLLVAGGAAPVSAQMQVNLPATDHGIRVVGSGEVKTQPDVVVITYTLRGEGLSSDDAVRAMAAAGARIDSAVSSIDPAAEAQTDKVQVTPVKGADCKERDYGPRQLSTGVCATIGFVAEQGVTVRSTSPKDAGTIVGLVGRNGGDDAQVDRFALRDPGPAERQAIAAAIADAKSKATAVAAESHLKLGPVLSISTVSQNPMESIIVTGSRLPQPNAPAAPPPVVVNVTPEPISTSATVTITYQISQ
jgi:uncharacterized protein YggE